MELRQYLAILRRRWIFISLNVLAAVAVAWVTTPQAARYVAESVIYVGSRQLAASPNDQIRSDPLLAAERLTATFATMIDSRPIAEDALARSGLPRSAGAVVNETQVAAEPNTQLIRVRVTDATPSVARDLANALAHAFVEKVQQFEPGTPASVGDVPTLPAYVFQEATLPVVPEPTALTRNLVIAFLFGAVIGGGVVLLMDYLDVTVKSAADAEARLELPVLGTIPLARDAQAGASRPRAGLLAAVRSSRG